MNADRTKRPAYDDGSPLGTERSQVLQTARFLRKQDSISAWIESEPLRARATVTGDKVTWLLSGVSVPGDYTMFVSHFPRRVPVERRTACAKAISRCMTRHPSLCQKLAGTTGPHEVVHPGAAFFAVLKGLRVDEDDRQRVATLGTIHRKQ